MPMSYLGLLFISFLSATILPIASEGALLLLLSLDYNPTMCLLIATLGNSLGGLTNYGIGLLGNPNWLKKVGVSEAKLQKSEPNIRKYGSWLAFFTWVPIIGDPLGVALGFFRIPFLKFLVLMVFGKFLRYALLVYFF
jgi:membrane protein YqaA with SNARE-associated domain